METKDELSTTQSEIKVMSRCLSAPDATSLAISLLPEPSSILYYLQLNSGIGHTKKPAERGFVRYMPFPFYPASCSVFPATWEHGQSYASNSHTLLTGFHLLGGAGGKLPPQTLNLPPQSNS